MADVIANIILIVVTVATAAAVAIYLTRPILWQYLFPKQMRKAMGKFIGKSNDIQPFSHLDSLPGIQYQAASEDFIYFGSRQKAYDELFEALNDDSIHMIGLYGEGGSGKTTLVTEVGKQAEDRKMFDKVISITVSRTPNIRAIQGKIADMLNLKLGEESEEGRAQRLWMCLKRKKRRILFIVNNLWGDLKLNDIGIHLDDDIRKTWKILITTPHKRVCTSLKCQKKIKLKLLFEDESLKLFKNFARFDEEHSTVLNDVRRELCNECMGLPITIKIVGSLFNERKKIDWQKAVAELRTSKASDDEEIATSCCHATNLSYDHLPTQRAKKVFRLCSLFPEEYHIQREDLLRYAHGLHDRINSLQSTRRSFSAAINTLLKSCLVDLGSVKMHNMVRDAALWIANRSDNCKIMVNVDKPLSTVAEDNRIKDCFAVSSWWFNENPSFCELHAPNLKMLLVNISAHTSLNSLDLSNLTFEGIQGLQVFSLTINYKRVSISFPPSIQVLTNVRTLRLNGLNLGDISFIVSLTTLEVLDLRRCYFNELPIELRNLKSLKLLDLSECLFSEKIYNRAIGKCSQLEELYVSKCYPHKYVDQIIMDILILPNLQRFVLGDPIIPESTRVLHVNDFDISKLRTSNKNILQIAETISLKGLHGGCKNIIPDMVGVVGGMNNMSTLHLTECEEIECIFDDLIPRLTELSHGPPLQVLHFFEKLEVLGIDHCEQLHIIFPRQCNLRNLKILNLSYCKTDAVLFSESIAQSLQQLEQLTIHGCSELKHIISASGSQHGGCSTIEEIVPAPMNSQFLMTNIKDVNIYDCERLESIFPLCYVEGVPRLQKMHLSNAPNLKYVFGKCGHEHRSSYQNHAMLPHLEVLQLFNLKNLIGMCPENYQANWPSQSLMILEIWGCPEMAIPWFNLKASQHHLNEIWSLQCLQWLTLGDCEELKCLFSMETHTSLPELMYLCVYNCQNLEQIVAPNEELVELPPNAELYFPKLIQIEVQNCNKLKSIFPFFMVTMLPRLSILYLSDATQLQEVFRHSQADGVMNELEIVLPKLTEVTLADLPNFVDICHGSKLHVIELLQFHIYNCPKIAPGLTKIQDELPGFQYHQAAIASEDRIDSSSISNDVEDFIYFGSRQKAYDELFETLNDDSIHMIGLYGDSGSGKTTLVTEVGKQAVDDKMFDKVISITVSQTQNIRDIQETIADMLKLKLPEETEVGRAQRLWMSLKEKRILIIVHDLRTNFDLMRIGIHLDNATKQTCKILITTPHQRVCRSMGCQRTFHLELLSEDESWNLFQKFARIDDERSKVLHNVPRELCNECMGLPIAIKIVGSLFKGRKEIDWQKAVAELRASKASDDEEIATSCRHVTNLSYDHLPTQRAKKVFLLCTLFPEEYHIQREDLLRYAHGIKSLPSMRSSFGAAINTLLAGAKGSVSMG
ncbi:disease resistance protein [Trifolium repens]|nr:disease resistance protein [Trifolium repens]